MTHIKDFDRNNSKKRVNAGIYESCHSSAIGTAIVLFAAILLTSCSEATHEPEITPPTPIPGAITPEDDVVEPYHEDEGYPGRRDDVGSSEFSSEEDESGTQ